MTSNPSAHSCSTAARIDRSIVASSSRAITIAESSGARGSTVVGSSGKGVFASTGKPAGRGHHGFTSARGPERSGLAGAADHAPALAADVSWIRIVVRQWRFVGIDAGTPFGAMGAAAVPSPGVHANSRPTPLRASS